MLERRSLAKEEASAAPRWRLTAPAEEEAEEEEEEDDEEEEWLAAASDGRFA